MPHDANGQHFTDMVPPAPLTRQPLDVAAAVNALSAATPEARRRFLAERKTKALTYLAHQVFIVCYAFG